ncbi:MAG TPA: squalene/phytoene synthase family protein [Gemmatimonadaceae bacterium]|nr:squalene/phytoene synthase family protein [Gemmatimonadaceae bacterium]
MSAAPIPQMALSDAEEIRAEMQTIAAWAKSEGMAAPSLEGQLIRPLVALAGWKTLSAARPSNEFWCGAMAIQLAHEASLVHDDVVDESSRRRGAPTLVASHGVAAALVQGDHLLTTAYRYAARTRSAAFIEIFARAVERTVAGELAQARASGRKLDFGEYSAIATGKSGELLGCALALAPSLSIPSQVESYYELGKRIGLVYQMLDDLLDLAPETDTGKPALADYAKGHWTWPLDELGIDSFGLDSSALTRSLHRSDSSESPMRRCLARYDREVNAVAVAIADETGGSVTLSRLLEGWRRTARDAVRLEEISARSIDSKRVVSAALLTRLENVSDTGSYFAKNSRSFRFASRFFPGAHQARVARVYAYCRFTDDLVDDPAVDAATSESLLGEWLDLSRRSYFGSASGVPFLDLVMQEMSSSAVPFIYAEELAEGMRMDLRGERYESMEDLRRYTYRVASVVGLWISELFDVRDRAVLQRAESMGHAMQLTNILRDVGEDLAIGRLYLPADLMRKHGVTVDQLKSGAPDGGYSALMEEMINAAVSAYAAGFEGIPHLPQSLRFPVSVAAHVYRGILGEIRRNGYDNLRRRALTSGSRKLALAARALLDSRSRIPLDRGLPAAGAIAR